MQSRKIVVLGTGGTIAGTAASPSDSVGYQSAQLGIERLIAELPKAHSESAKQVQWVSEQVTQVDSKDMDQAVWQLLASRILHWQQQESVQAIVVTHGTDTLEETAYFLHRVLKPSKPVVLTCAMRPATALLSDGPQNIVDAVAVACDSKAHGVLVVCAGRVHHPLAVQKVHTYRLDAFDSGDLGSLAGVYEGRVEWRTNPSQVETTKGDFAIELILDGNPESWPKVAVVSSHAGADEFLVDALVSTGVDGLVIAGTGNGSIHTRLESALLRATQRGVVVWLTSRCQNGPVFLPSRFAAIENFALAQGLNPYKARISLMLELMRSG